MNAAFYAAAYLRKHKLAEVGTRVRVTADIVKDPPRLDNFRIFVDVPPALDPKHIEGLERAVHQCLIHSTLLRPPRIALEIHAPALTAQRAPIEHAPLLPVSPSDWR